MNPTLKGKIRVRKERCNREKAWYFDRGKINLLRLRRDTCQLVLKVSSGTAF